MNIIEELHHQLTYVIGLKKENESRKMMIKEQSRIIVALVRSGGGVIEAPIWDEVMRNNKSATYSKSVNADGNVVIEEVDTNS
jgi:hypothetical protein